MCALAITTLRYKNLQRHLAKGPAPPWRYMTIHPEQDILGVVVFRLRQAASILMPYAIRSGCTGAGNTRMCRGGLPRAAVVFWTAGEFQFWDELVKMILWGTC